MRTSTGTVLDLIDTDALGRTPEYFAHLLIRDHRNNEEAAKTFGGEIKDVFPLGNGFSVQFSFDINAPMVSAFPVHLLHGDKVIATTTDLQFDTVNFKPVFPASGSSKFKQFFDTLVVFLNNMTKVDGWDASESSDFIRTPSFFAPPVKYQIDALKALVAQVATAAMDVSYYAGHDIPSMFTNITCSSAFSGRDDVMQRAVKEIKFTRLSESKIELWMISCFAPEYAFVISDEMLESREVLYAEIYGYILFSAHCGYDGRKTEKPITLLNELTSK